MRSFSSPSQYTRSVLEFNMYCDLLNEKTSKKSILQDNNHAGPQLTVPWIQRRQNLPGGSGGGGCACVTHTCGAVGLRNRTHTPSKPPGPSNQRRPPAPLSQSSAASHPIPFPWVGWRRSSSLPPGFLLVTVELTHHHGNFHSLRAAPAANYCQPARDIFKSTIFCQQRNTRCAEPSKTFWKYRVFFKKMFAIKVRFFQTQTLDSPPPPLEKN